MRLLDTLKSRRRRSEATKDARPTIAVDHDLVVTSIKLDPNAPGLVTVTLRSNSGRELRDATLTFEPLRPSDALAVASPLTSVVDESSDEDANDAGEWRATLSPTASAAVLAVKIDGSLHGVSARVSGPTLMVGRHVVELRRRRNGGMQTTVRPAVVRLEASHDGLVMVKEGRVPLRSWFVKTTGSSEPHMVRFVRPRWRVPLTFTQDQGIVMAVDLRGRPHPVRPAADWAVDSLVPVADGCMVRATREAMVHILPTSHLQPEHFDLTSRDGGDSLVVTGRGRIRSGETLILHGMSAEITGETSSIGTGFRTEIALSHVDATGVPHSLAAGRYELTDSDGRAMVGPSRSIVLDGRHLNVKVKLDTSTELTVRPALGARAEGPSGQRQLSREHSLRAPSRAKNTVLFDCFSGRSATDNTRAIHDEMRRQGLDFEARWSVRDLSVPLPDGVQPLVAHSDEWWHELGRHEAIITNCWLPKGFVKQPYQYIVQAWHGTPLKTLGLDRRGTDTSDARRGRLARDTNRWSLLLAQNPYSEEIFRRSYLFEGPMLTGGYPRNDRLARAANEDRIRARASLGITDDRPVVLYAPTWREDGSSPFDSLDIDFLAARTGAHVLVRGHAITTNRSRGRRSENATDVTLHPDLVDLFLAADVLVTDYSSVMFDWAITGRPIAFLVPDLDDYVSNLRGTYFDLRERAPGPLLTTTAELAEYVSSQVQGSPQQSADYLRWQREFVAGEDGHWARRVVDRLRTDLDW